MHLAHAILERLASHDFYSKDVSASHEQGSFGSRHWEIVGRQYIGHQPYDVHIQLADEEDGTDREARSGSAAGVTVDVVVRVVSQLQFVERDTRDAQALADDLLATIAEAVTLESKA